MVVSAPSRVSHDRGKACRKPFFYSVSAHRPIIRSIRVCGGRIVLWFLLLSIPIFCAQNRCHWADSRKHACPLGLSRTVGYLGRAALIPRAVRALPKTRRQGRLTYQFSRDNAIHRRAESNGLCAPAVFTENRLFLVSDGKEPIEDQRQHGPQCNARDIHPRDRKTPHAQSRSEDQ